MSEQQNLSQTEGNEMCEIDEIREFDFDNRTAWNLYFQLSNLIETADINTTIDILGWALDLAKLAQNRIEKEKIMNAKVTEMQNSFVVSSGEDSPTYHFLKTNPMAEELAKMKLAEVKMKDIAEQVSVLLEGMDSMLIPIEELARLSLVGGEVGVYLNGIVNARTSLLAAGVEAAA